jgi:hypothetical protein
MPEPRAVHFQNTQNIAQIFDLRQIFYHSDGWHKMADLELNVCFSFI